MGETRYSWREAMQVAEEIGIELRPWCERIEIAGSLRRKKPDVGDIEILYIPIIREERDDTDLFASYEANKADERIQELEHAGILERRLSTAGHQAYGPKNKLMRHVASGIPVDLFSATRENWFNYFVCRTGPADLNARIATKAQSIGWKWNPYGPGFTNPEGEMHPVLAESDVFDFVGIPYQEPEQRR